MSRRRGWWYHTRDIIRSYPVLQEKLDEMKRPSISSDCRIRSGSLNRSTEQKVLKSLRPVEQRNHDAVDAVVRRTKALPDGEERLMVIRLVHWQGSHTLTGAARVVHVSESTAKRWQRDFFRQVAMNDGLIDVD